MPGQSPLRLHYSVCMDHFCLGLLLVFVPNLLLLALVVVLHASYTARLCDLYFHNTLIMQQFCDSEYWTTQDLWQDHIVMSHCRKQ